MRMRAFYRDAVFVVGLYNLVVGLLFFFLFKEILDLFRIEMDVEALTPLVRLAAVFLLVFGVGYLFASRDVVRNHLMLFLGLLQNAGVAGVAAWYWINEPGLMPNACLLPAGLSALFAIVFLVTWPAALVEARLQRRRARLVRVAPSKPVAAPADKPAPAESKVEAPEVEPLPAEEKPAEGPPEAPEQPEPAEFELPPSSTEPHEPAHEPPLRPLAHRDRSGGTHDETPDSTG
jgi:hypothetical protein